MLPMLALVVLVTAQQDVRRVDYIYRPIDRAGRRAGNNPFAGVLPGLLLVGGAGSLLMWNEGRTLRQERMLGAAARRLIHADGSQPLDPEHNGHLVHVHSAALSSGVEDPLLGAAARRPGLARLRTKIEAFQWVEHEREDELRVSETHVKRTKRYSYNARWSTSQPAHMSGPGAPMNPTPRLKPGVYTKEASVTLENGVLIPAELVRQLKSPWLQVPLSENADSSGIADAAVAPMGDGGEALYLPISGLSSDGEALPPLPPRLEIPGEMSSNLNLQRSGTTHPRLPVLKAVPKPAVGDCRVTFQEITIPAEGFSILAQQASGSRLLPWVDSRTQHSLFMLVPGDVSAGEMLRLAHSTNAGLKWALRGAGTAAMSLGMYLSLRWMPSLASMVPLLGSLLGPFIGIAAALSSVAVGLSASALAIGVAWLYFRPLRGVALLVAAVSCLRLSTSQRPARY